VVNFKDHLHIFEGVIVGVKRNLVKRNGPGVTYGQFPVYFFARYNKGIFHGKYQSLRIYFGDFRKGEYQNGQRCGKQFVLTLGGLYFYSENFGQPVYLRLKNGNSLLFVIFRMFPECF
jgi:hypothetical protein